MTYTKKFVYSRFVGFVSFKLLLYATGNSSVAIANSNNFSLLDLWRDIHICSAYVCTFGIHIRSSAFKVIFSLVKIFFCFVLF